MELFFGFSRPRGFYNKFPFFIIVYEVINVIHYAKYYGGHWEKINVKKLIRGRKKGKMGKLHQKRVKMSKGIKYLVSHHEERDQFFLAFHLTSDYLTKKAFKFLFLLKILCTILIL